MMLPGTRIESIRNSQFFVQQIHCHSTVQRDAALRVPKITSSLAACRNSNCTVSRRAILRLPPTVSTAFQTYSNEYADAQRANPAHQLHACSANSLGQRPTARHHTRSRSDRHHTARVPCAMHNLMQFALDNMNMRCCPCSLLRIIQLNTTHLYFSARCS